MKLTGKKYKCIGLHEVTCKFWKKYFSLNKTYKEVAPPDSDYDQMKNKKNLLLLDDEKHLLIVDVDQFKLTV